PAVCLPHRLHPVFARGYNLTALVIETAAVWRRLAEVVAGAAATIHVDLQWRQLADLIIWRAEAELALVSTSDERSRILKSGSPACDIRTEVELTYLEGELPTIEARQEGEERAEWLASQDTREVEAITPWQVRGYLAYAHDYLKGKPPRLSHRSRLRTRLTLLPPLCCLRRRR